ncbi:MAG: acetyl-CoA C-acyltransferase [Deltaproteobacteria bacterium]|nr:acetyl-CoA C-acyltransferase [Deltaproteobacteria bacterium]MBT7153269.1 acetyl-CoA C-acyltransferase [Deltaproteobacteria bacterium]MBT7712932.1 acetyl-CoA C-acyltransferase [Deltaproteobacteria bacterium]MBT7893175.1 acetyl-CoA C-acyltransferase [Deltaproteobacteria bacterium]
MKGVVIIGAKRTPIGAYCGSLREIPVEKLAANVLEGAVTQAGVKPEEIDDVILGQSFANGESPNLARLSLLEAGWPVEIPGYTIDRRCCSGIQSIWNAAMQIQTGNAQMMVAGGAESMSRCEFYIPGDILKWGVGGTNDPKWGFSPRQHGSLALWGLPFYDRIQRGRPRHQPIERFGELSSMMTWAETAAKNEGITRAEADRWAWDSHRKAIKAIDAGCFENEIIPVTIKQKKSEVVFDTDETPREDTTLEKLAKLRTVYEDGICTAGNSSSENDGSAALVLTTPEIAAERGIEPMVYLKAFGAAGADPTLTYPAVPVAVNKALKMAGLSITDIGLIEIQEAFAAQTLADAKLMGIEGRDLAEKVNVNGSGISLGHPIGATGSIRLTTLIYEMIRRNVQYGLVTICGGGGLGICAIVERK